MERNALLDHIFGTHGPALIHRHRQRGDTSFLHVMRSNDAHQLYLRMGFEDYLASVVRVISREAI